MSLLVAGFGVGQLQIQFGNERGPVANREDKTYRRVANAEATYFWEVLRFTKATCSADFGTASFDFALSAIIFLRIISITIIF